MFPNNTGVIDSSYFGSVMKLSYLELIETNTIIICVNANLIV